MNIGSKIYTMFLHTSIILKNVGKNFREYSPGIQLTDTDRYDRFNSPTDQEQKPQYRFFFLWAALGPEYWSDNFQ